jgi:ankyrin repeat protein
LCYEGADVNQDDENGMTPLLFAASTGHKGAVNLLLKYGAPINNTSIEQAKDTLNLY